MASTWPIWIAFIAFVLLMLAVDLGVFHRRAHRVGIRESLIWTAVWIVLALAFSLFIHFAYEGDWQGLGHHASALHPEGLLHTTQSASPYPSRFTPYVSRFTPYVLLFTISSLLLFEHLSVLPLSNFQIPDVYKTIAQDKGDFTVLEIPLAWRNGFRMTGTLDQAMMFAQWYQTEHRHPILGGNTSRNPELKFQYFTEMPVVNSLIAVETGHTLEPARMQADRELAGTVHPAGPAVRRGQGGQRQGHRRPREDQGQACRGAAARAADRYSGVHARSREHRRAPRHVRAAPAQDRSTRGQGRGGDDPGARDEEMSAACNKSVRSCRIHHL